MLLLATTRTTVLFDDTIELTLSGFIGNLKCLSIEEALYRTKLRDQLTGEVSQEDTELSALEKALGLSTQQIKELEADVRKELNNNINPKEIEAFEQIVNLMRLPDGSLSDDKIENLLDLGIKRGIPRSKTFEIINNSFECGQ